MYGTILEFNVDEFTGVIKTDKHIIKWEYDSVGNCCESFGGYFDEESCFLKIGSEIVDIDIEELRKNCNIDHMCCNDGDMNGVNLIITMSNGDYKYFFYNCHNGYYTHNLDVYVDEEIKFNVAL